MFFSLCNIHKHFGGIEYVDEYAILIEDRLRGRRIDELVCNPNQRKADVERLCSSLGTKASHGISVAGNHLFLYFLSQDLRWSTDSYRPRAVAVRILRDSRTKHLGVAKNLIPSLCRS